MRAPAGCRPAALLTALGPLPRPSSGFSTVGALNKEPFSLGRCSVFLYCFAARLRLSLGFRCGESKFNLWKKGASFLI
eukprot:1560686-Pyramimonas_sp.AAC.1